MRTKQVVVNHNILWGCCFIYFSKIKPLNYAPPSLGKQSQKEESIRACKRRWQVCAQARDLMTPGAAGRVGVAGGGEGRQCPGASADRAASRWSPLLTATSSEASHLP